MAQRRTAMESGERDQTIVIQERPIADVVDSSGAPTEEPPETAWTTLVASMPASKQHIRGDERLAASQLSSPYDTRWEINYRADMDPDLLNVKKLRRVVHRGKVHDIVDASQIGRREGIELLTLARA